MFIVELVVTVNVATWFWDKSQGTVPFVIVSEVAAKLWARLYCWAVFTTATRVPTVADPVLMVMSPTSVVVKLPIVPVVELSVPIVPAVLLIAPEKVPVELFNKPLNVPPVIVAVLEVSVWIVPLVMLAAVEVVVPAVRVGIVPVVMLAVLDVRFGIVPVVIEALVETRRVPVEVPYEMLLIFALV
ncbi:MAG: hypothetical protein EBR82_61065 [Caulobacteraceae bacterium]|nr:hypothetical protein [Caulobacteraceae bacterium]